MKFLDFFAGVGGFRRGMELSGHECVGFCEYDRFAVASYTSMHLLTEVQREYLGTLGMHRRQKEILKEEYRNGEWYADDIRKIRGGDPPQADCWCFGAPCQSFSLAGKRAGLEGESGLIREIFRILRETGEEHRPEWLVYENVKGMFSSSRGFDYFAILSEMDELGYDVEWQLFNSKDWGVPQNRERVYTVGHLRRCGSRKIFPFTGKDGADCVSVGQAGSSGAIVSVSAADIQGAGSPARIHVVCNTKPPECTRLGEREDVWGAEGIAGALTATEYKLPHRVAIPVKDGTKKGYSVVHGTDAVNFAYPNSKNRRGRVGKQVANTLDTACSQGIFVPVSGEMAVYAIWYEKYRSYIAIRKLTPKECFRLQGWRRGCGDDRYFERAQFVNSDSQLYKQAGNGVTVNVVEAIGKELTKHTDS